MFECVILSDILSLLVLRLLLLCGLVEYVVYDLLLLLLLLF